MRRGGGGAKHAVPCSHSTHLVGLLFGRLLRRGRLLLLMLLLADDVQHAAHDVADGELCQTQARRGHVRVSWARMAHHARLRTCGLGSLQLAADGAYVVDQADCISVLLRGDQ